MRVVFDSNIYVSALVIPGGAAERAIEAVMTGSCSLVISRPIIHEVLGVLARKFNRDLEELSRTAVFLSGLGDLVAPRMRVRVARDEPDNRILECAMAGHAEMIVTGDRELLALGTWEGIRLVSLREFLTPPEVPAVGEPRSRYGMRPFPSRGGIVTNEVIDRLRLEHLG